MPADNVHSFDYTDRLGFAKMPPGYLLIGLDTGHFLFERESDEEESAIHWNKWAVRKWAWADYRQQQEPSHDGAAGVPHSRSRRQ